MRATTRKIVLCVVAVVALFSTASCSNDSSSWYPSGAATVVSSYETSDDSSKVCMITLKIVNTGQSTINAYTISLTATTNARTYYKTISENFVILPGKSAYVNVEIAYNTDTEALTTAGLSITDEYYQ